MIAAGIRSGCYLIFWGQEERMRTIPGVDRMFATSRSHHYRTNTTGRRPTDFGTNTIEPQYVVSSRGGRNVECLFSFSFHAGNTSRCLFSRTRATGRLIQNYDGTHYILQTRERSRNKHRKVSQHLRNWIVVGFLLWRVLRSVFPTPSSSCSRDSLYECLSWIVKLCDSTVQIQDRRLGRR